MSIYLQRNNKTDTSFEASNDTAYFKPGHIYQLVSFDPMTTMSGMVKLKVKGYAGWLNLTGSLDCFDYVRKL